MFRGLAAVMLSVVALGAATAAWANLSIDKLWIEFADGRPGRSDVVIRNDSEERYYIDVAVSEILNPGTEAEERVTIADPEALGLLVTPNRLILEPGALRSIRLVSLNESLTQDRIYRVMVRPQVGAIQTDDVPVQEGSPAIVMKLMAAYDVLVVARPQGGEARLVAERSGTEIALRNTGNTNLLVAEGQVCPKATSEAERDALCRSVESQRIYAGNTIKVALDSKDDVLIVKTRSGPSAGLVEQQF